MIKTLTNLRKQEKEKFVVPKGVQDVIPITAIYDDGIFQIGKDKFSKNVIGYDELGGLKIAYVLGEKTALPQGSNLQVTAMNLQKLFVKMTEKGGGENE